MRSRILLLVVAMVFATSAPQAKGKLQINVELDPSLPEKESSVWLGYLLARANYVSEHEKDYDTRPGPIVPQFEEELSARRTATQIYRELRAADPTLTVPYFDDLSRVDDAGFLGEYVWVYLRQAPWKTAPDATRMKEFEEWRLTRLVDHKAQTRGRLAMGDPEDKGKE